MKATSFIDKAQYKYVPINKGGEFKRYNGNKDYVINIYDLWNSNKVTKSVRRSDPEYYFKKALNWSYVTTGKSSFRISEHNVSATAAPNLYFENDNYLYYALAFTNSCITQNYLNMLNPTINLNVTNVSTLPFIINYEKMDEIIEFIDKMVKNGSAYEVNGDVYFSVEADPKYGELSHQKLLKI